MLDASERVKRAKFQTITPSSSPRSIRPIAPWRIGRLSSAPEWSSSDGNISSSKPRAFAQLRISRSCSCGEISVSVRSPTRLTRTYPANAPICPYGNAHYWTYYADSATFRGIPVLGDAGYHPDDWEGVQIRIRPDGSVDERASSHEGYNQRPGPIGGWASDAGIDSVKDVTEALGLRAENGWGPETHVLIVSGGSHAGNTAGIPDIERLTLRNRVHLIPLEPIAADSDAHFAINPPWRKKVWRDPEAEGTD